MPVPTFSGIHRLSKPHKLSAAGLAAVGAASLAFAVAPAQSDAGHQDAQALSAKPVALQAESLGTKAQQDTLVEQSSYATKQADAQAEARKKAMKEMADKKAVFAAEAQKKNAVAAQAQAKKERAEKAASRSAERKAVTEKAATPTHYADNLDGWIKEALSIMKAKGIPGSYEGIHRNIIRESGGDPRAINNWDVNAQNGIPSKGLLQVIQPTFDAYHVAGTPHDLYDPVANIVAACNYAADRYGSMDNVDSAY